jgi:NitT/TauT family transport system permease protein
VKKSTALILSAIGFLVFLLVWEGFAQYTTEISQAEHKTQLVPSPSQVPKALWNEIQLGIWQEMAAASLSHYLVGLLLGSVLGVTFGVLVALLPRVSAAQVWIVRILRPIPPLAWIPFAINWFGVSETAAAFIISIGVFWINYFISLTAVEAVDKDLIEVAQSFGHRSAYARLTKVILPGALPGIMGGLRTGLGQGWMTVIAAELFGVPGIGQRMNEAAGLLANEVVVVYMLTIGALYGITDYLFVLVQNRLLAWQK